MTAASLSLLSGRAPRTLEAAFGAGRHNNLDAVRLGAALAVVISHAWPLALGPAALEPGEGLLPVSLGGSAVLVFFFVSGLLITASAHRRDRTLLAFAQARAARVLPGLAAALLLTSAAFAVFAGPGFDLAAVGDYVARGLTLVSPRHDLPDLFVTNPYPLAPNGPLWTLFYEIACYVIVAACVFSGALRRHAGWVIAGIVTISLWAWSVIAEPPGSGIGYRIATGAPLAVAFFAGALSWRLRAHLVLDWRLGGFVAVFSGVSGSGAETLPIYVLALGYVALLLAYRTPAVSLGGDISYGVYIYGWPVAQVIVACAGPIDPVMLAMVSSLAVLPIALASWVWIERPALVPATSRATA